MIADHTDGWRSAFSGQRWRVTPAGIETADRRAPDEGRTLVDALRKVVPPR